MDAPGVDGSLNQSLIGKNFFADRFRGQKPLFAAEENILEFGARYFEGFDGNGMIGTSPAVTGLNNGRELNGIERDGIKNRARVQRFNVDMPDVAGCPGYRLGKVLFEISVQVDIGGKIDQKICCRKKHSRGEHQSLQPVYDERPFRKSGHRGYFLVSSVSGENRRIFSFIDSEYISLVY